MQVEFEVNNSRDASARYLTWSPCPCRVRVSDRAGSTEDFVDLTISARSSSNGGEIEFRRNNTGTFQNSISLRVPTQGESVSFYAAGKFDAPSTADGDVAIQARDGTTLLGSVDVMVRIRKNADTLTAGERDRFISAMARLNNQGQGRFTDFREMHTNASDPQAHGEPAFLPWHRAYLLDLERELQAIDASVALPYWRFDQVAPALFRRNYLGESDRFGNVEFDPTNPLSAWTTDSVLGINRSPNFDARNEAPPCNVDRLWAKWQRQNNRFDQADPDAFEDGGNSEGHNLSDTMWPWNGITSGSRPPTAPGGALTGSPAVNAPGPEPYVRDMLDYQGAVNHLGRLGFDYDDVEYGGS